MICSTSVDMKKKGTIILIILEFSLGIYANLYTGVRFNTQMPKTNIKLFESSNQLMPSELEISFDMYLAQPLSIGQVLMLECGKTVISFTYIGRNKNDCNFVLSPTSNKKKYIEIPFVASRGEEGKWFTISISVSTKSQSATVSLDKRKYTLNGLKISSDCGYNVFFGPNESGLSDVPPMAIANVVIKEQGKSKFVFPLNESDGEIAIDTISNVKAKVENPVWLINSHHYWKHIGTLRAAKTAGIAYDSKRSKLVIVNPETLVSFGLKDNAYSKTPIIGKKIVGFSGEAIYSATQGLIFCYNLYDGDGITSPFVAKINTDGKVIKYSPYEFHNPLHHHAMLWDENQQQLSIFGGYGNYSYSDKLLMFNEKQNKWDSINSHGDRITPRMHTIAGVGADPNLFYIYGGIGNETGKQELGKEFYSDLYVLNIKTTEIKRLWSDSSALSHLVPKRNLIFDPDQKAVIFLCTNRNNGKIGLYSFDVETGQHRRVSNETLVNTNCISSTAYLFYDKNIQKYCMAIRQAEDNKADAKIEIFSLNYPAISYEQLNKPDKEKTSNKILFVIISSSFIFGTLFYFLKKKSSKKSQSNAEKSVITTEESNELSSEKRANAIFLFGEFAVINRDGANISARFSSKIKQLFTLILLNSIRYNEGISTEKLSLTIWTNKDVSDAKNIRGVTINHLRTLLKELDGISLIYVDEKWNLTIDEQCYCDYKSAIQLQKQASTLDSIREMLTILKRGALLPAFYQYDWFEKTKIEYDELLFNQLESGISLLAENKNWNETILAANTLISFDHLNENALKYKIIALSKLGKLENAQKLYDKFCKEYLICYNEKYKVRFSDLQ